MRWYWVRHPASLRTCSGPNKSAVLSISANSVPVSTGVNGSKPLNKSSALTFSYKFSLKLINNHHHYYHFTVSLILAICTMLNTHTHTHTHSYDRFDDVGDQSITQVSGAS